MVNGGCQIAERVVVAEGELRFERGGNTETRVPLITCESGIRVGCHHVSWEAWKLIKRIIERAE